MQHRMTRTRALAFALALFATACTEDDKDAPDTSPDAGGVGEDADAGDLSELQVALDSLAASEIDEMKILGLGITVELADGRVLEASAGRAGPREDDAAYDVVETKQVIGSATKLYTALLVMQLVEQGKIGLDDTIERWFQIPKADAITVRMLLNHTSGLNDCLNALRPEEYANVHTPAELVQRAVDAGAWSSPGAPLARYSNTNFVLLAMLVEAVTGRSWEHNVHERIAAPLGLTQTFYAGEPEGREGLSDGWVPGAAGWTGALSQLDPSIGWGMGGLVATNHELSLFAKALFAGTLFKSRDTLPQMLDFELEVDPATLSPGEPSMRMGLGVQRYVVDDLKIDGHLGHILGYNSGAFRDAETGALITVTSNADNAIVGLTVLKVARYLREHPL